MALKPEQQLAELAQTIAELKAEVNRLRAENLNLRGGGSLDDAELKKAEQVLVKHGKTLSHDEIRKLLKSKGVTEPVINLVVARVDEVLKKVKSGSVLAWDR